MGDIFGIGGVAQGIGTATAGLASAGASIYAADTASKTALTGYNYLKNNAVNTQAQGAGSTALTKQAALQDTQQALLTGGPDSAAAKSAFANYLNSTGYNFQRQQGTAAITGSAAARGLLGSGGTAKALTRYGQGLGREAFGNYLRDLGSLNQQYENTGTLGLNAAAQVASGGTTGGVAAGGYQQSGYSSAGGQIAGAVNSLFNPGGGGRFPDSIPVTPNQITGNYFGGY